MHAWPNPLRLASHAVECLVGLMIVVTPMVALSQQITIITNCSLTSVDANCNDVIVDASISNCSMQVLNPRSFSLSAVTLTNVNISLTTTLATCTNAASFSMDVQSVLNKCNISFKPKNRGHVRIAGSITGATTIVVGSSSSSTMVPSDDVFISATSLDCNSLSSISVGMGNGTLYLSSVQCVKIDITAITNTSCYPVHLNGTTQGSKISMIGAGDLRLVGESTISTTTLQMTEATRNVVCSSSSGTSWTFDESSSIVSSNLSLSPSRLKRVMFAGNLTDTSVTINATTSLGPPIQDNSSSSGDGIIVWGATATSLRLRLSVNASVVSNSSSSDVVEVELQISGSLANASRVTLTGVRLRVTSNSASLDHCTLNATSLLPGSLLKFSRVTASNVTLRSSLSGDDIVPFFLASMSDSRLWVQSEANCSDCSNVTIHASNWGGIMNMDYLELPVQSVSLIGFCNSSANISAAGLALTGSIVNSNITAIIQTPWVNQYTNVLPEEVVSFTLLDPPSITSSNLIIQMNNSDALSFSSSPSSSSSVSIDGSTLSVSSQTCTNCSNVSLILSAVKNSTLSFSLPSAPVILSGVGNSSTVFITCGDGLYVNGSYLSHSATVVQTTSISYVDSALTLFNSSLDIQAAAGAENLLGCSLLTTLISNQSSFSLAANTTNRVVPKGSWLVDGSRWSSSMVKLTVPQLALNASNMAGIDTTVNTTINRLVGSGTWRFGAFHATITGSNVSTALVDSVSSYTSTYVSLTVLDANIFSSTTIRPVMIDATLVLIAPNNTCSRNNCSAVTLDATRMTSSTLNISLRITPVTLINMTRFCVATGTVRTLKVLGNVLLAVITMTVAPLSADSNSVRLDSTELRSSNISITTADANSFANVMNASSLSVVNCSITLNATSSTCSGGTCTPMSIGRSDINSSSLTIVAVSSHLISSGSSSQSLLILAVRCVNMTGKYAFTSINATVTTGSSRIQPTACDTCNIALTAQNGDFGLAGQLQNSTVSLRISNCTSCNNVTVAGSDITDSTINVSAPQNGVNVLGLSSGSILTGNIQYVNILQRIESAKMILTTVKSNVIRVDLVLNSYVELRGQDGVQTIRGAMHNSTFKIAVVNCTICGNITVDGSNTSISQFLVTASASVITLRGLTNGSTMSASCSAVSISGEINNGSQITVAASSWAEVADGSSMSDVDVDLSAAQRIIIGDKTQLNSTTIALRCTQGPLSVYGTGGVVNSSVRVLGGGMNSSSTNVLTMYGGLGPNSSLIGTAFSASLVPFNFSPSNPLTSMVINSVLNLSLIAWAAPMMISGTLSGRLIRFINSSVTFSVSDDMTTAVASIKLVNVALTNSNFSIVTGTNATGILPWSSLSRATCTMSGVSLVSGASLSVLRKAVGGALALSVTGVVMSDSSILSILSENGTLSGSLAGHVTSRSSMMLYAASENTTFVSSVDTTLIVNGSQFLQSTLTVRLPLHQNSSLTISGMGAQSSVRVLTVGTLNTQSTWLGTKVSAPVVAVGVACNGSYDTVSFSASAIANRAMTVNVSGTWSQSNLSFVETFSSLPNPGSVPTMSVRYLVTASFTSGVLLSVAGLRRVVTQDPAVNTQASIVTTTVSTSVWGAPAALVDTSVAVAYSAVLALCPVVLNEGSSIVLSDVQISVTTVPTVVVAPPTPSTLGLSGYADVTMLAFCGIMLLPGESDETSNVDVSSVSVSMRGAAPQGATPFTRAIGIVFGHQPPTNLSKPGASYVLHNASVNSDTQNISSVGILVLLSGSSTTATVRNVTVSGLSDFALVSSSPQGTVQQLSSGILFHAGSRLTTLHKPRNVTSTVNESFWLGNCTNQTLVMTMNCTVKVTDGIANSLVCSPASMQPSGNVVMPVPSSYYGCNCTIGNCTLNNTAPVDCLCLLNQTTVSIWNRTVSADFCLSSNSSDNSNIFFNVSFVGLACNRTAMWALRSILTTVYDPIGQAMEAVNMTNHVAYWENINVSWITKLPSSSSLSNVVRPENLALVTALVAWVDFGLMRACTWRMQSWTLNHTLMDDSGHSNMSLLSARLSLSTAVLVAQATRMVDCEITWRKLIVDVHTVTSLLTFNVSAFVLADGNSFFASRTPSSSLSIVDSTVVLVNNSVELINTSTFVVYPTNPATLTCAFMMVNWAGWDTLYVASSTFSNMTTLLLLQSASLASTVLRDFSMVQGGNRSNLLSGYGTAIISLDNVTGLVEYTTSNPAFRFTNGQINCLAGAAVVQVLSTLYAVNATNRSIEVVPFSPQQVLNPVVGVPARVAWQLNTSFDTVNIAGGHTLFLSLLNASSSAKSSGNVELVASRYQCSPQPSESTSPYTVPTSAVFSNPKAVIGNLRVYIERSSIYNCTTLGSWNSSLATGAGGLTWACGLWNDVSLTRNGLSRLMTDPAAIDMFHKSGNVSCRSISRSSTFSSLQSTSRTVSHLSLTTSYSNPRSRSRTSSVSTILSRSTSISTSATLSHSASLSVTVTVPITLSRNPSSTRQPTVTRSILPTPSASTRPSESVSDSITATNMLSLSSSATASQQDSISTTTSPTTTVSLSTSSTISTTTTDSVSISIDPCNKTFRSNPDSFIRRVAVLTDFNDGSLHNSNATFFVVDRVSFAVVNSLRVQIGFNTYLRNFYYNTSLKWFPLPKVQNCIASGYELVNATDFIVRIDYDPTVSLRTGVYDSYDCSLTFSSDIFQCQLITNFTFNFTATIHVAGTPQTVNPFFRLIAGIASSVVAFLSGGSALLQQSRASALSDLSSCQFSLVGEMSTQDSPTQYGFGSEIQFYHRGCVAGNLMLVFVFGFVVFIIAAAVAICWRQEVVVQQLVDATANRSDTMIPTAVAVNDDPFDDRYVTIAERKETYREALTRVCGKLAFPSVILLPCFLLIDSTILSSVSLIVHPVDDHDVAIGCTGCAFYGILFVGALMVTVFFVKREEKRNRLPRKHLLTAQNCVARALRWLLVPEYEYPAKRKRQQRRYAMLRFLFEESKYAYFICCDMALSLVVNSLLGIGISERPLCLKLALVALVCYVAFYVTLLYLRPNVNRLSMFLTLVGNTLGVASATCTLVSMAAGAPIFGQVTQVLSLVMLALSFCEFGSTWIGIFMWLQDTALTIVGKNTKIPKRRLVRDSNNGDDVESCTASESDLEDVHSDWLLNDLERKQERAAKKKGSPSDESLVTLQLFEVLDDAGVTLDSVLVDMINNSGSNTIHAAVSEDDQELPFVPLPNLSLRDSLSSPSSSHFQSSDAGSGLHVFREYKGPSMMYDVVDLGPDFMDYFKWPEASGGHVPTQQVTQRGDPPFSVEERAEEELPSQMSIIDLLMHEIPSMCGNPDGSVRNEDAKAISMNLCEGQQCYGQRVSNDLAILMSSGKSDDLVRLPKSRTVPQEELGGRGGDDEMSSAHNLIAQLQDTVLDDQTVDILSSPQQPLQKDNVLQSDCYSDVESLGSVPNTSGTEVMFQYHLAKAQGGTSNGTTLSRIQLHYRRPRVLSLSEFWADDDENNDVGPQFEMLRSLTASNLSRSTSIKSITSIRSGGHASVRSGNPHQ